MDKKPKLTVIQGKKQDKDPDEKLREKTREEEPEEGEFVVSERQKACPYCGKPIPDEQRTCGGVFCC